MLLSIDLSCKAQHENRHDDGRLIYFGGDYFINPRNTFTLAFFKNATKDMDGTILDYDLGAGRRQQHNPERQFQGSRSYNQMESNYTRVFVIIVAKIMSCYQENRLFIPRI